MGWYLSVNLLGSFGSIVKVDRTSGGFLKKFTFKFSASADSVPIYQLEMQYEGSFITLSSTHTSGTQRIVLIDPTTDLIVKSITYGPNTDMSNLNSGIGLTETDAYVPYLDLTVIPPNIKIAKCSVYALEACSKINPVDELITPTFLTLTEDLTNTFSTQSSITYFTIYILPSYVNLSFPGNNTGMTITSVYV